ncbi:hypothetical protein [uncultured Shewanella sp.]|uniref:hypothetical protein n=1 Tax=uncultured Shewanella sp. TaxID=173975 RepID=UPI002618F99A|nr:hypothetical protein [uncultured Shewanella sp.]
MKQFALSAAFSCMALSSSLAFADVRDLELKEGYVSNYLWHYEPGWISGENNLNLGNTFDTYHQGSYVSPADRITSITFYETVVGMGMMIGMKVDYAFGGSSMVGSSAGRERVVTFHANEFITKGQFTSLELNGKNDTIISHVELSTNYGNRYQSGLNLLGDIAGTKTTWELSPQNTRKTFFTPYVPAEIDYLPWAVFGFKGTDDGDYIRSLGVIAGSPIELELVNISYNDVSIHNADRAFLANIAEVNATDNDTSVSVTYSQNNTSTLTNTFTDTRGIKTDFKFGYSVTAGNKAVAEVKKSFDIGLSLDFKETIGETSTNTTTETLSITRSTTVPAKSIVAMRMSVFSKTGSMPYTMTYKNPYDDSTFDIGAEIEAAVSVESFNSWLQVGYVDDNGNNVIYDEFKADYGDVIPTTSSLSRTRSDGKLTLGELGVNMMSIDVNDPRWEMSDEEIEFRQENGLL